jgi:hypothetical protein
LTNNIDDETVRARATERLPLCLKQPSRSTTLEADQLLFDLVAVLIEKGIFKPEDVPRCKKVLTEKILSALINEEKEGIRAQTELAKRVDDESWKVFLEHTRAFVFGAKVNWFEKRQGKTISELMKSEIGQGVSSDKVLTDTKTFISELSRYDNFRVRCGEQFFTLKTIP